VQPVVWRRILVPGSYSFWDLHVAVQDSMGWKDCHLHESEVAASPGEPHLLIGIPLDEPSSGPALVPGWEVAIETVFRGMARVASYRYDFGDDWTHAVVFEQFARAKPGSRLPVCLDGAGACPPEDCGGPHGYQHLLEALADPKDPEHDDMVEWAGGGFDPHAFTPSKVKFDDPKDRWKQAFGGRPRR
jgi:hypothetical protein